MVEEHQGARSFSIFGSSGISLEGYKYGQSVVAFPYIAMALFGRVRLGTSFSGIQASLSSWSLVVFRQFHILIICEYQYLSFTPCLLDIMQRHFQRLNAEAQHVDVHKWQLLN